MGWVEELRFRLATARHAHELHDQLRSLEERNKSLRERNKSLRERMPNLPNRNIAWVFGGAGRTGGSWLSGMMAEAFGLTLWFEPRIGDLFNPEWIESQAGRGYVFDPKHEAEWLPAIRNFLLTAGTARFPNAKGFVIKENSGTIATPLLLKAFPGSKPVLLLRDPRDVVASWNDAYAEGGWRDRQTKKDRTGNPLKRLGADEHTRRRTQTYVKTVTPALDAFERYRGRKSLVTYEELRNDAAGTLARIAEELDLPKGKIEETAERHSFEAIPEDKRGPGKFHRKANPGSWREDLTPAQARAVEEIAAPLLERFYP